jgi:hypothetical protein
MTQSVLEQKLAETSLKEKNENFPLISLTLLINLVLLFVSLFVFFSLLKSPDLKYFSFLPLAFLSGSLGSSVNVFRKKFQLPSSASESPSIARAKILFSYVIGGIFGLVMLWAISSGLMSNIFNDNLLPKLLNGQELKSVSEEFRNCTMLMTWCFAAGFADELVPSFLKGLVSAK